MLGYHRQARILGATRLRVNEIVWTHHQAVFSLPFLCQTDATRDFAYPLK